MAGVRSKGDHKGGIVPYNPDSNGSRSQNVKEFQSSNGKKANGSEVYEPGNNNAHGSGSFAKTRNFSPDPGQFGPSAPAGSHFGAGGGTTRGNSFGDSGHNAVPQRSQHDGVSTGYPVVNNHGGYGGPYVTGPEPVRSWPGSEPTGPTNLQLEGSGKTSTAIGSGRGAGGDDGSRGYSSHVAPGPGMQQHHHHYYYPSYDKRTAQPMEEQKRRRRGAGALAAALIACWACTCCCHVPCGC